MADDIHIFDFKTNTIKDITHTDAQEIIPMWAGDDIFFLSDRDRTMNLFVYHLKNGETEKVTHFTEYDIKFPSINGNTIVFENAGYLYKMDVKDKKPVKLSIQIGNEKSYARNEWKMHQK
jgi:tricorn protease